MNVYFGEMNEKKKQQHINKHPKRSPQRCWCWWVVCENAAEIITDEASCCFAFSALLATEPYTYANTQQAASGKFMNNNFGAFYDDNKI